jgi:hypothetical protein
MKFFAQLLVILSLSTSTLLAATPEDLFWWMGELKGEWMLSEDHEQFGSCKHDETQLKLVDKGITFKFIGQGTTIQEDLLPNSPRQMVTMYHCLDIACTNLKATHYCVKKNQPQFIANLKESSEEKMIFDCDMSTEICQSNQDHVHTIVHELLDDGDILKTSYLSWKDGKPTKSTVCTFVRVEED